MDLTNILSENGRELKLLDGYKFSKSINTVRGEKWRCCKKSCRAVIFVNGERGGFSLKNEHNHEPDHHIVRAIVNNLTKNAICPEDLNEDPAALFWKEMSQIPKEMFDQLTTLDLKYLRKNFYRKFQLIRLKGQTENKLKTKKTFVHSFGARYAS